MFAGKCSAVLFILACLSAMPGLAQRAKRSTAQKMADGAVTMATMKLNEDRQDEGGLQLLRFALTVDRKNRAGLLLQARLERGKELGEAGFADGGKLYARFLKSVLKKTKSTKRQLLLWKVIEIIQPENEDALLRLTQAKNEGMDTGFDALLAAMGGKAKRPDVKQAKVTEKPKPESRRPKKSGKKLNTLKVPTTAEELHAALKKTNRGYNGKGEFKVVDGKIVEADLRKTGLSDISALRGLPLVKLELEDMGLRDVSPIEGMPLERLGLSNTDVDDISVVKGMPLTDVFLMGESITNKTIAPLEGMPLTELFIAYTRVTDISIVEGMPLQRLCLHSSRMKDLSPLKGMRLTKLLLERTPVKDISVLRGMPLRELGLFGCARVRDLTPLAACTELEKLAIPARCREIEFLRDLPRLEMLDNSRPFWEVT